MSNVKCTVCSGTGEVEDNGPKACRSCGGNGTVEVTVHAECYASGKCQETEGFIGTEHEGVNVCEDGCVWFKPNKK